MDALLDSMPQDIRGLYDTKPGASEALWDDAVKSLSEEEVEKVVRGLKETAPGPSGVRAGMLKAVLLSRADSGGADGVEVESDSDNDDDDDGGGGGHDEADNSDDDDDREDGAGEHRREALRRVTAYMEAMRKLCHVPGPEQELVFRALPKKPGSRSVANIRPVTVPETF